MSKKLNLQALVAQSTIASIQKKEIAFISIEGEECEAEVYVKKLSYDSVMSLQSAVTWDFDAENIENSKLKSVNVPMLQALRVLNTVCCDVSGTPLFQNVEQVYNLVPSLGFALYQASDDVNNFLGKSQKSNSKKTSFGVSSLSTGSVAKQSKKRKAVSRTEKPVFGENTEPKEEV